jgi:hypothetical protein
MIAGPNAPSVEHRRKPPSVLPGGCAIRRVKDRGRPCGLSFGQAPGFVDPHVAAFEPGDIVPHTGRSGGTLLPAR